MKNIKRAADTNQSPSFKKKKDYWDDSVKNDKDVKVFPSMDKAFHAAHMQTKRQLRAMVLSVCAINMPVGIGLITKNVVKVVMRCLIWWSRIMTRIWKENTRRA